MRAITSASLLAALLVAAGAARAQNIDRGRLLYDTHCATCHTERLHTLERWTRKDYTTMEYMLTVDDPGAYTAPWTTSVVLTWEPNTELFEYVCQQQNYAHELMVGEMKTVNRTTVTVP